MKKLFLELSFAALCAALLSACGSESGTNGEPLEISSNSSSESVDEYDSIVEEVGNLPKCVEGKDGEVYYVKEVGVAYTCRYDGKEKTGEWVRKKKKSADDDNQESSSSVKRETALSSSGESEDASSSSEESEVDSSSSEKSEDESSSSSEEEFSSSEESSSSSEESCSPVSLSSSDASIYNASANTLKDLRDGQIYKTTTIDIPSKSYSEVWMAENLNFETDNSWCGGGSETTEGDCSVYGRLYTWAAAVAKPEDECGYGNECGLGTGDIRGACPKGWHLPSQSEWDALFTAVGGSSTADSKLKSQTGWTAYSGITNEDTFGFSALPAGCRYIGGSYNLEGGNAYFWSSTEYYSGRYAYYMYLRDDDSAYLKFSKDFGFSVRCLKD